MAMASANINQFLQKQECEYNKHQRVIKAAETTVKQQIQIKTKKEIPKKHRPKPPTILDSDNCKGKFLQSFQEEYKRFFLKHLDEAISLNTITIELERARCLEVIRRTEKELCRSSESPEYILKQYTAFLQRINLLNHEFSPELQMKLHHSKITPNAPAPSLTPNAPIMKRQFQRKRKCCSNKPMQQKNSLELEPRPMKQMRLDHFLAKSQRHTTKPI